MKTITSLTNPLIKRLVSLRKESNARKVEKSVVVFGDKQVSEIAAMLPPSALYITQDSSSNHIFCEKKFLVNAQIMKKISGQASPPSIAAEFPYPEGKNLHKKNSLLLLETLQDPGNVGTLGRTALALGIEGIILLNCTDPFHQKSLQAAKGAFFKLPFTTPNSLDCLEKYNGFTWYGGMLGSHQIPHKLQPPFIIVLGNEGHGLSTNLQKKCLPLTIPMKDIDSLNVASAGAILLYNALYGHEI